MNLETADELLKEIEIERTVLIKEGKIKKTKPIAPINDDEIPFEIPKNWKWVRLNDVGVYKKGPFGSSLTKSMFVPKSANSIKVYEQQHAIQKNSNLGIYYITEEYFESNMRSFEVFPGDIIVSCAGTIGETFVMPENIERGIINQALMKMSIFSQINLRYFLLYFDYTIKKYAQKTSQGSVINNIPPFDIFKKILMPLPPLSEQKKIVKVLDELFELIEKAKANINRNIENAEEMFQSKLTEYFSGINKDCCKMKTGWDYRKIGEILNVQRGGSPRPISAYITTSDDGINWIKISDASASDKYIYRTQEKIKKDGLKKSRFVEEGDFLLSNSMSFGRPYILKTNGCIHDGWLVLRNKNVVELDNEYLYYVLSSSDLYKQFDDIAGGSTVRNLNTALVSSVKIPLPPLSEQKQIVKVLDELSAKTRDLKDKYTQKLIALDELKKSALEKAFRGELT